jgi:hypothetical protein
MSGKDKTHPGKHIIAAHSALSCAAGALTAASEELRRTGLRQDSGEYVEEALKNVERHVAAVRREMAAYGEASGKEKG